jgi:hypothetical protein
LIGDAPRDVEAGKAAGCRTILFMPPGVAASPAAGESSDVRADHTVTSLKDAIEHIAQHRSPMDEESAPAQTGESAEQHPMSIPQHPHLPPRVESAARANDPVADESVPNTHPHAVAPRPLDREHRDTRLLSLASQILDELRRSKEQPVQDFSVAKMMAGITQVLTLAVLFMAYLYRRDPVALNNTMLFALTLQAMTIALLIFNRQR